MNEGGSLVEAVVRADLSALVDRWKAEARGPQPDEEPSAAYWDGYCAALERCAQAVQVTRDSLKAGS